MAPRAILFPVSCGKNGNSKYWSFFHRMAVLVLAVQVFLGGCSFGVSYQPQCDENCFASERIFPPVVGAE